MEFDQRKVVTLVGTLVLAGAVVAAGIYGPSAWKVLRPQTSAQGDQVLIQNPPIDSGNTANGTKANQGATPAANGQAASQTGKASPTVTVPAPGINTPPQEDTSGTKKYKEPDMKQMNLAPSIAGYFGESALSESAKTLTYGAAWNIHQYVDGYLFGPTAGPQMNEPDIKKYIVFFKSMWEKQLKSEPNAAKVTAFGNYLDVMFNRGMDAFDSKDKARIEQFHQEIHDLDTHLFRNDTSSKIYGATPFATKR